MRHFKSDGTFAEALGKVPQSPYWRSVFPGSTFGEFLLFKNYTFDDKKRWKTMQARRYGVPSSVCVMRDGTKWSESLGELCMYQGASCF